MAEQLIFVGTYAIPGGQYEEFVATNREMTAFVKDSEPRLFSFHSYVNEDGTEATTIQIHPDSASLEYHLEVASRRIQSGVQLLQTKRIELYGNPSQKVVELLSSISERSGGWPLIVKKTLHGFINTPV